MPLRNTRKTNRHSSEAALPARFREGRAVQQYRYVWPTVWGSLVLFPYPELVYRLGVSLPFVLLSFYLAARVRVDVREGCLSIVNVFSTSEFDLGSSDTVVMLPRARGRTRFDMYPLEATDGHRTVRASGFLPLGLLFEVPDEKTDHLVRALHQAGTRFRLVDRSQP